MTYKCSNSIIINKSLHDFVYREGNDLEDYSRLTYRKLLEEVCRFANVLKSKGVTKGDRVAIYMPMILELPIAMLACTRIGAVHNVVVSKSRVLSPSLSCITDVKTKIP